MSSPEITDEQYAYMSEHIARKWQENQTRKVAYPAVKAAVDESYRRENLGPPLVVLADGPVEMAVSFALMVRGMPTICRRNDPIDMPTPPREQAFDRVVDLLCMSAKEKIKELKQRYGHLTGRKRAAEIAKIAGEIEAFSIDNAWPRWEVDEATGLVRTVGELTEQERRDYELKPETTAQQT